MGVRPLLLSPRAEQQRALEESLIVLSPRGSNASSSVCLLAAFSAACGFLVALATLSTAAISHRGPSPAANTSLHPYFHFPANHHQPGGLEDLPSRPSTFPDTCDSSTCYQTCASLTLAQEVGTRRHWLPPSFCGKYLQKYVQSGQYGSDFATAIYFIEETLGSLPVRGDGTDLLVLDIDETALSNLPYYEENQFGVTPFNATKWNQWVLKAEAPPFDAMLKMYTRLLAANWRVAFITGRGESQRSATMLNLQHAGYHNWTALLLRSQHQAKLSASEYKSQCRAELEKAGYTIWGNVGDQWTDLEGRAVGKRIFKLPNPFYYVP